MGSDRKLMTKKEQVLFSAFFAVFILLLAVSYGGDELLRINFLQEMVRNFKVIGEAVGYADLKLLSSESLLFGVAMTASAILVCVTMIGVMVIDAQGYIDGVARRKKDWAAHAKHLSLFILGIVMVLVGLIFIIASALVHDISKRGGVVIFILGWMFSVVLGLVVGALVSYLVLLPKVIGRARQLINSGVGK